MSSFGVERLDVGEPALGPPAFMHRPSGRLLPIAPITHHWFDSTHTTQGVVTAGFAPTSTTRFEVSAFNGLHGRPLPVATGARLANHGLRVMVVHGDGDGYGEGLSHFLNAARRNLQIVDIVQDNRIYGLTKGQYSPTSEQGKRTPTSPHGAIETPVNPLALAITAGATFVARGYSYELQQLAWMIGEALEWPGYALIDVLQPCVTWNKSYAYDFYTPRVYKLEDEDGYNPADREAAWEKSWEWGDRIPLGILYRGDPQPTYEDQTEVLTRGPLVESIHFGALAVVFWVVAPSATVRLTPATDQIGVTVAITADPELSDVDIENARMPATVVSLEATSHVTIESSGREDAGATLAQGRARLTNLTDGPLIVPPGTILATGDTFPVRFETLEEVILPAGEAAASDVSIRALQERGIAFIYISHRIDEVMALSQRITVLKDGRNVGTVTTADTTASQLVSMMVGREVILQVPKGVAQPGPVVLNVDRLQVVDDRTAGAGGRHLAVRDASLHVRAGEILGVAGVQGNGQTPLVEALTGLLKPTGGTVTISGTDVTHASPRARTMLGMAHIPENRHRYGMVDEDPIRDNLVLDTYHQPPFSRRGLRDDEAIDANARRLVEQFSVHTPSIDTPAGSLSGGNQQKVVVARELGRPIKLLIAAQPTRGLDVGSIEFIHGRIVEQRDSGVAVLLVSAELDEILSLSDRVAVMYEGEIIATLDAAEATRERVGLLMAGVREEAVAAG